MKVSRIAQVLRATFVLGFVVAAISGCGSDSNLIPVTGRVTIDGQPLPPGTGTVSFVPKAPNGKAATGNLSESGSYEMSSHEVGDGVLPGEYDVVVTWMQPASGDAATGRIIPPKLLIPERFTNPKTSGLSATVNEDSSEFDFDLASEAAATGR